MNLSAHALSYVPSDQNRASLFVFRTGYCEDFDPDLRIYDISRRLCKRIQHI
jgi:hypothetical protein